MEVVGTSATVRSADESLREGAALTLLGNVSPRVEFPLQWIVTRQIHLTGSCARQVNIRPASISLRAEPSASIRCSVRLHRWRTGGSGSIACITGT